MSKDKKNIKKRNKGFTLVEIIIALAIAAMIMAAMYSFFTQSTKTSVSAEVKSELQEDAEKIQTELVRIGTQSKMLHSLVTSTGNIYLATDFSYDLLTETATVNGNDVGKAISVSNIVLEHPNGYGYSFDLNGNELTFSDPTTPAVGTVLSKNVKSFKIRPIDINNVEDSKLASTKLGYASGIQVIIELQKKKGYTNVTCPVEVIIKFRNKDVAMNTI